MGSASAHPWRGKILGLWKVSQKGRLTLVELVQESPLYLRKPQSFFKSCCHQLLSLSYSVLARGNRVPTPTCYSLFWPKVCTTPRHSSSSHEKVNLLQVLWPTEVFFPSEEEETEVLCFLGTRNKELGPDRNRPEANHTPKITSPAQPEPFLTKPFNF